MSKNSVENPTGYIYPYRTNYELIISILWFTSGLSLILFGLIGDLPFAIYGWLGFVQMIFGILIIDDGVEIYLRKKKVKGYALQFVSTSSSETLDKFNLKDEEVIKNVKNYYQRVD